MTSRTRINYFLVAPSEKTTTRFYGNAGDDDDNGHVTYRAAAPCLRLCRKKFASAAILISGVNFNKLGPTQKVLSRGSNIIDNSESSYDRKKKEND